MKLAALDKMQKSSSDLDRNIRDVGLLRRALGMPEAALRAAAADCAPMIRSMLQGNLARAGIKTKTGTLRNALRGVTVGINLSKARIAYGFPAGVKGYKNNPNFYEVAGSLNYGAVRQPMAVRPTFDTVTGKINRFEKKGALGEKAKRRVKSIALKGGGGNLSIRQNRLRASRTISVNTSTRNNTAKSVLVGSGIVVIKPRQFFILSPAQKNAVRQYFVSRAAKRLRELANRG